MAALENLEGIIKSIRFLGDRWLLANNSSKGFHQCLERMCSTPTTATAAETAQAAAQQEPGNGDMPARLRKRPQIRASRIGRQLHRRSWWR